MFSELYTVCLKPGYGASHRIFLSYEWNAGWWSEVKISPAKHDTGQLRLVDYTWITYKCFIFTYNIW